MKDLKGPKKGIQLSDQWSPGLIDALIVLDSAVRSDYEVHETATICQILSDPR